MRRIATRFKAVLPEAGPSVPVHHGSSSRQNAVKDAGQAIKDSVK
jgi:hypothetical protein